MPFSPIFKWRLAAALTIVAVSAITATGVYYATQSSSTTGSADAKSGSSAVSENPSNPSSSSNPSSASAPATIYATVGMHVEQAGGGNNPDYVNDESRFWQDRNLLLEFATMLKEEKVTFDFMSDTTFLQAVAKYDKDQTNTGGKNIVQYLHDDLGVSIDPHAHETDHNYADVAYLISQLGVTPTGVVGGFLVDTGTEKFHAPITGELYPSYTWTPTILWGGGTGNHINESSYWTSGIWRPSTTSFTTDDPTSTLPDVGNYKSDWVGFDDLLSKNSAGTLSAGKIYTITIMTNLRDINQSGYVDAFKKEIESRKASTESGEVKWLTLPDVIDVWKTDFDSVPNRLSYDGTSTSKDPFSTTTPSSGTGSGKAPLGAGSSGTKGSCGDGVCQAIELQKNVCPEDCK